MHALPDSQLPKLVVAPRVDQSAVQQHQKMPGTHRDLLDLASLQRSANAQILIQLRIGEVLPRGLRRDAFGDVEIARASEISAMDPRKRSKPDQIGAAGELRDVHVGQRGERREAGTLQDFDGGFEVLVELKRSAFVDFVVVAAGAR